jgi:hypothetical protein
MITYLDFVVEVSVQTYQSAVREESSAGLEVVWVDEELVCFIFCHFFRGRSPLPPTNTPTHTFNEEQETI